MTDLIKQLTGRARFCRDRGEEKTPGLLEEAAAQLAEAQAAQALVVERAEEAVDAEWRRKVGLNCTEVCAIIRALAPVDGLALVRELRAERDAADQRDGAMLARIVAIEADGEAARSAASTNFARAVAAEADRDRLAAANAVLEAKVAGLVEAVKPFDAVGGTLFSKNWNMSDIVFDGGPMRSDCLFFEDFLNLRAALATQEAGTC